ncbi:putative phosphoketolase domain protein [Mycobacterium kansasii 824]|nr:putative phosphoketolase domain protein [Mycobacterium kansasii 824]
MHQRIPQLAALVNRPRGLGRDMAGDTTGKGELPKQPPQSFGVFPMPVYTSL